MSRILRRKSASGRSRHRQASPKTRLLLRVLEDRIAPAAFTVTSTGDTGTGSGSSGDLRYCITQANATPGPNTINYASGVSGTILTSALSTLTVSNNLTINGAGSAGIALGGGTLDVSAGATLTLNAFSVSSGYLAGAGTIATDPNNGAKFGNVTSSVGTFASNSAADQFVHFTNAFSALKVVANGGTPVPFSGIINQGAGTINVGANTHVTASGFQDYGVLTLAPGTTGSTQMTNISTTSLSFNGGSRTFVSNVANIGAMSAGIDLNGQNASLSNSFFVNNGYVTDSSYGGSGTHQIIDGSGSLVLGAGFFQNPVVGTGVFQPGNGPGSATFGSFHLSGPTGNTGVSSFQWQINDAGPSTTYPAATGVAGPAPNAALQVSGWGLVKVGVTLYSSGNFSFDATPTDKLTFGLQTLSAPNDMNGALNAHGTFGSYPNYNFPTGAMSEFDPTQAYVWPVVKYQGTYTGPTDSATLNASTTFSTSQFVGGQAGTFGWVLAPNTGAGGQLDLVYTPPPTGTTPAAGSAPATPNTPTVVANGPNSITVSWNAINGATNYRLESATSPTGPWSQIYYGYNTTFTDDNSVTVHISPGSTHYYQVAASDAAGDSAYSGVASATTPHVPTPTVNSVVVNDGSAQRSEVRSIKVSFSSPVTFAGGNANAAAAFVLHHVQTGNDVILSATVSSDVQGHTIVTLTFSGGETDLVSAQNGGAPSLADGRYTLTISGSAVSNVFGYLDGAGNGTPGTNYVSPTDTLGGGPGELGLYRIFGDTNGDGIVDQIDLGQFRSANNSSAPDPAYLAFLDANNDTHIDQVDLGEFRLRNNSNVF
jgi:hypothetical protein